MAVLRQQLDVALMRRPPPPPPDLVRLERALAEHGREPDGALRASLERAGVPERVLSGWPGAPCRPLAARIVTTRDGIFDFDDGGEMAVVHGAWSIWDDFDDWLGIDLVAWQPARPERVWTAIGVTPVLGPIERYRRQRRLTRVFRTPLAWLAADGLGVVALEWMAATAHLRELRGLIAEDLAHSLELERRLRPPAPAIPPILVPRDDG